MDRILLKECIVNYIWLLCGLNCPSQRLFVDYSNNKPWVTNDIKLILNSKQMAFRTGNREEVKTIETSMVRKKNKPPKKIEDTKIRTQM